MKPSSWAARAARKSAFTTSPRLKNSVSYDVLTSWRLRLRRKTVNGQVQARPVEAAAALA